MDKIKKELKPRSIEEQEGSLEDFYEKDESRISVEREDEKEQTSPQEKDEESEISPEDLQESLFLFKNNLEQYFFFEENKKNDFTMAEELDEFLADYPKEKDRFKKLDETLIKVRDELKKQEKIELKNMAQIEKIGKEILDRINKKISGINDIFYQFIKSSKDFKGGINSLLIEISKLAEFIQKEILRPLIQERLTIIEDEDEEETEDKKKKKTDDNYNPYLEQQQEEEDEPDYYDNDLMNKNDEDDNMIIPQTSIPQNDDKTQTDDDSAQITPITRKTEENEKGNITVIETDDSEVRDMWEKMAKKGLVKGKPSKIPNENGVYIFKFSSPVFPKTTDISSKKEFIKTNQNYNEKHNKHFQTIANPLRIGEFYPEAIFLDENALDLYLDGQYAQLRTYLTKELEDFDSVNRLPVHDENAAEGLAPHLEA